MAKDRMLKFVTLGKETPEKRSAPARAQDFDEIYREFAAEKAAEQASRCSQCGVPYCQSHCPLHNNIPDWLRLTAEGRLQEAYEISQATNTFPEICGRICRRTACAKATASSNNPATAPSPSARSRSTLPTPHGKTAGCSRSAPMLNAPNPWASSARAPVALLPPTRCAAKACRSPSMTATTAPTAILWGCIRPGCWVVR